MGDVSDEGLESIRGNGRAQHAPSFDYHKLTGSKPEQRTVHPYHVGQIEHGWYMLAYDPARKAVRTFALKRIAKLTMLRTKFVRDPRFNAREHLGCGFGVCSYAREEKRTHEVHTQRVKGTRNTN